MDTRTAGLSDFLSSMLVPLLLASVDVVVLSVVVGLFLCGLLDVECVDVAAVLSVEVTAFGIVVVVVAVVVVVFVVVAVVVVVVEETCFVDFDAVVVVVVVEAGVVVSVVFVVVVLVDVISTLPESS